MKRKGNSGAPRNSPFHGRASKLWPHSDLLAMLLLLALQAAFGVFTQTVWLAYASLLLLASGTGFVIFWMLRDRRHTKAILAHLIGLAAGLMLFCALVYWWVGTCPPARHIGDALYFSVVTWTTLGYGDFKPLPDYRLFAALEALLGYVYMGLIVGILASVFKE